MNNLAGVPGQFKSLFWDTDTSNIDIGKHKTYIIERILEYGDTEAVRWMSDSYLLGDVLEVLDTSRALSQKSGNFLAYSIETTSIDEFDALCEEAINSLVGIFRNIYIQRQKEVRKPVQERWYQLHSLALIGVRSVLGIENEKGSPFNVQQSLHIPNLTQDETFGLFKWYEKESGQKVEKEVIERLFWGAKVIPEFPTGNGKIDLTIIHGDNRYGLELKSYTNEPNYSRALEQAAKYGAQLKLNDVFLVFFVEYIEDDSRKKYEKDFKEKETGVLAKPVFIETGN